MLVDLLEDSQYFWYTYCASGTKFLWCDQQDSGSKANAVCVAYDGLERFFPKDKIIFTGNPVRKDILDKKINAEQAKQSLGLNQNKKTVLIFGGKRARTINEAVLANADALLGDERCQYHLAGW